MRPLILAAALVAPLPAAAQPRPEVEAVLDQALFEQKLFLTCSALDDQQHVLLREQWGAMVTDTLAALDAAGYDKAARASFGQRADYAALMPAPAATFAEVARLCRVNANWHERLAAFDFVVLPQALDGLLEP